MTMTMLAMSTDTPTERSMPPDEMTMVRPSATIASMTTLLTSTLNRLAGVRKVGLATEKKMTMAAKAMSTLYLARKPRTLALAALSLAETLIANPPNRGQRM